MSGRTKKDGRPALPTPKQQVQLGHDHSVTSSQPNPKKPTLRPKMPSSGAPDGIAYPTRSAARF
jgi:hypothetical protein